MQVLDPAVPAVLDGTVEAFAALADLRSGADAEHSRTLARWAVAVARELGLDATDTRDVAVAARLHDIGQAGVPDAIANKPGMLDEVEWAAMRRHAALGADVLALIPELAGAAVLVRHHHERWDGQGHPAGLAGEDIPLGARIVGVCEALAALLTERPYRRAYDRPTALAVLDAAAGGQFDPDVVEALGRAGVPGEERITPARTAAASLTAPPPAVATRAGRPASPLIQAFDRLERLPASKEAHRRLVALTGGDVAELDVDAATAAIDTDIALTVTVLGRANAGRKRAVASVRDAVQSLGTTGLRDVLEHVGSVGVFHRVPGWEMTLEQFRLHAVATQRAADHLARTLGREGSDGLLVAALLHDVGKLVLATAHVNYPSAMHGGATTPEDRLHAERRELGVDHAVAGGVMARRWGLPAGVVEVIEHHHDRTADDDVAIVRLADMLAHHGHGRDVDPGELAAVAGRLGLSPEGVRELLHELPEARMRRPSTTPSPLSRRETEILKGLAAGHAYQRIADDLGVALSTARSHGSTAFAKLDTTSRAQAVLTASAAGWI